jgi:hypothetical protein
MESSQSIMRLSSAIQSFKAEHPAKADSSPLIVKLATKLYLRPCSIFLVFLVQKITERLSLDDTYQYETLVDDHPGNGL